MRKVTVVKSGVMFRRHRFPGYHEPARSPLSSPPAVDKPAQTAVVSQEILAAARQEAYDSGYRQGLEAGTLEGLSQGREQAQQQACAEGQEKGYRDGLSQGQEEIGKILAGLNRRLQGLDPMFSGRRQELLQGLLVMVQEICRRVILTELKLQPGVIQSVVQETLQCLPETSDRITIHVNPRDLQHLKPFQTGAHCTLVEDVAVEPGDCRVVTDQVEATAAMEDRLSACMDVVREILPEQLSEQLSEQLAEGAACD